MVITFAMRKPTTNEPKEVLSKYDNTGANWLHSRSVLLDTSHRRDIKTINSAAHIKDMHVVNAKGRSQRVHLAS